MGSPKIVGTTESPDTCCSSHTPHNNTTNLKSTQSEHTGHTHTNTAGHTTRSQVPTELGDKVGATSWTCPMHPQIIRDKAGSCPICGMALEPLEPNLEEGPNPELVDFTRRFWVSLTLSIPLLVLTMGADIFRLRIIEPSISPWVQLLLTAPIVLWGGWPFFERGWSSIVSGKLNMFTLIAIGVGAAFMYSLAATLAPNLFPVGFAMQGNMVPVYYEAAGVVVTLVLLGQVLELRARAATGKAIRALLNLAPKMARRVDVDGAEADILLAEVMLGDQLRILPGQAIPVDGAVIQGSSTVDESMITGEALPVVKDVGGDLTGGTINGLGSMLMEAKAVGSNTMLARIVGMVASAQRSRAPIQGVADKISGWFVPLVILISLATFAIWSLLGPEPRMGHALLNAIAVLIIACPCALGLATPMSIMVASGRGAQAGVLIKHAEALQAFDKVDTLLIDKTGTLTEGKPKLVAIKTYSDVSENDMLAMAASVEARSEHPLAQAIVSAAHERNLTLIEPENVKVQVGEGISAHISGRSIALGNEAQMARLGLKSDAHSSDLKAQLSQGAGVILIAIDNELSGHFVVADPIRATSIDAIKRLRDQGLRVIMLTGDNAITAQSVANAVGGLDGVFAGLKPEDKANKVAELKSQGAKVAMAGDGINDAPALAAADVGIAMGTGTDVAIESAGITLTKGDLGAIVRARALATATMSNIKQNLFFSFVFNGVGVPIAAGVLYPMFGILMSPMFAGAAMALSSFAVVMNALRLSRVKL